MNINDPKKEIYEATKIVLQKNCNQGYNCVPNWLIGRRVRCISPNQDLDEIRTVSKDARIYFKKYLVGERIRIFLINE